MMDGPLPSLNVSSSAGGGVPQQNGGANGGPKPPKRKVNFDHSAEGQMLYGGAAGGGEAPASGTMSRVLSLRTTKSAGSLFNFNAEDPQELLATAFDLPSMRGVPETLASPRTKMRRAAGMSTAMADRPAYVRRPCHLFAPFRRRVPPPLSRHGGQRSFDSHSVLTPTRFVVTTDDAG